MNNKSCNKCGKEGLVWAKSKKGNWYLSDPKTISTSNYGKYIEIPFAHRCTQAALNERNESFMFDLVARSGA